MELSSEQLLTSCGPSLLSANAEYQVFWAVNFLVRRPKQPPDWHKMSLASRTFSVIFLAACALTLTRCSSLKGVCYKREPYIITEHEMYTATYTSSYNTWCFGIPPRCTRYRTRYQTLYRTKPVTKYRTVFGCCVGYRKVAFTSACEPVCSPECAHGICTDPGKCTCHVGYEGTFCNRMCSGNKWGPSCRNTCRCMNGGTCNHVTGECTCAAGYLGERCDRRCPEGSYGLKCSQECLCNNAAACDHVSGKCHCLPGWTGFTCANSCPQGRWGQNCTGNCDCSRNGFCDHITGFCECFPGYLGDKCDVSCQQGFFGDNCAQECSCENEATCDNTDGSCFCAPGWTGLNCSERACPEWNFGENCTECFCVPDNTQQCHPWTGNCTCMEGWTGDSCDEPCAEGTYGQECNLTCSCYNNATCSPNNGSCSCLPGYEGDDCSEVCQEGKFGLLCAEICDCPSSYTCSHVDGSCLCDPDNCTCPAGLRGVFCDEECNFGTFGPGCIMECNCSGENRSRGCDSVNGTCNCTDEWTGDQCELPVPTTTEVLEETTEFLQETTECPDNSTLSDDATILNLTDIKITRQTSPNTIVVVGAVSGAMALIVCIAVATCLYIRGVVPRKTDTCHTFSNPVYAPREPINGKKLLLMPPDDSTLEDPQQYISANAAKCREGKLDGLATSR